MNGDRLLISDEAWRKIDEYQQKLNYDIEKMDDIERHEYARSCCLALFQEVAELTNSFQWKPWRDPEDHDHENMIREAVDIIFFLHHVLACFRIGPYQLDRKFQEVLQNNYRRISNGYNNTKGDTA